MKESLGREIVQPQPGAFGEWSVLFGEVGWLKKNKNNKQLTGKERDFTMV